LLSDKLTGVRSSTSKAIDALLKVEKEKSTLQSELSKCMERCKIEISRGQIKAKLVGQKLKESRMLTTHLQKCCNRAIAVKERATSKAREKAIQERSVHNLLK